MGIRASGAILVLLLPWSGFGFVLRRNCMRKPLYFAPSCRSAELPSSSFFSSSSSSALPAMKFDVGAISDAERYLQSYDENMRVFKDIRVYFRQHNNHHHHHHHHHRNHDHDHHGEGAGSERLHNGHSQGDVEEGSSSIVYDKNTIRAAVMTLVAASSKKCKIAFCSDTVDVGIAELKVRRNCAQGQEAHDTNRQRSRNKTRNKSC